MTEQEKDLIELSEEELKENEAIEMAYRQARQEDVPDLWNRIEEALPEKTPLINQIDENKLDENDKEEISKEKKKLHIFSFSKVATLIAACLCVFILVPYLLLGGKKNYESTACPDASASKDESDFSMKAAAEECEEASMETCQAEEATEMAEEPMLEDSTMEAEKTMEEAPAMNEEPSRAMNNTAPVTVEEARDLTVEIMDFDTTIKNSSVDGYQIVQVKILEGAFGEFENDSIINAYVRNEVVDTLKTGDQRKVSLNIIFNTDEDQQQIYMEIQE